MTTDKEARVAGPDVQPTPRDIFIQMLQDQVQILKDSLTQAQAELAAKEGES